MYAHIGRLMILHMRDALRSCSVERLRSLITTDFS
jgi:hypothetical protein